MLSADYTISDLLGSRVCPRPGELPGHAGCNDERGVSNCLSTVVVMIASHADCRRVDLSAESFYPEGAKNSDSFSRIVSSAHAARIKGLIDETKGKVVFGGDTDVSQRYIAPTVVRDVRRDDPLMGE